MHDRRSSPLFDAVPSYLRLRDGQEQRALEALSALLTQELQVVERDIDQLYDNWFVETCEPWVLPYIAQVIGARPMREIGPDQAGQLRAYVANVLQYRQAKGTAAALEQVARDVTGWPVVVVEFFKQLTTAENVNHVRGARPVTASVRRAARPERAHRPFSRASHVPAAGRADGYAGRFNIPNLGLFVWTRSAQPLFPMISETDGYLGGPIPSFLTADGAVRRFDPLGRDLPLVNLPLPDTQIAERVSPLNVPENLQRQPLADELDRIRDGSITAPQWFSQQPVLRVRLGGAEVPPEKLFCCNLAEGADGSVRRPSDAGSVLFDPVLGRLSLHASDAGKAV
ncbi:MAG: phage tail protein, partial [Pseudomonadota bacterium]